MTTLESVLRWSLLGLTLVAVGEVFGRPTLTLVGVGVFAAFFVALFALMTRDLVVGTIRERRAMDAVEAVDEIPVETH